MLNTKNFLIFWSICFLSYSAGFSAVYEEIVPIRPGYIGKFLKKSRDIYNGGVKLATGAQNKYRQTYRGQPEARPTEEWFGKLGLKHSCGDFSSFIKGDFSEEDQKQLNCQKIGLIYSLTPREIADFQSNILQLFQRGDILSVFCFLLQDIVSDAIECTDKGTTVSKTFQNYLGGIAPKVERVDDDPKKKALQAIVLRLRTLDEGGAQRLRSIMTKLVDDNIQYYLRQGFLSTKVFGFAESALKSLGGAFGAYASYYFYPDSSSYIGMAKGAALGWFVGKITGGKLKKYGGKLARSAQNKFYYNFIRENARRIIDRNLVRMHAE